MANDIARERVMHAILERQAARYGGRTFMYFEDAEFSFADVNRWACRAASGFQRLGIGKGDKVAIVLDNRPEFVFAMFGTSKLGAIQVPINTAHKGDVLARMLDGSDSRALIVEGQYLERVERVLPQAPQIETVIVLNDPVSGQPPAPGTKTENVRQSVSQLGRKVLEWAELVDNDGAYRPADVLWSDPFSLMYTSGTTGLSKGALTPHNLSFRTIEMLREIAGYDESDCFYIAVPLFHNSGQHICMTSALLSGAQVVLANRFSTGRFWDDVRKYGCTQFVYVGGMLGILLKAEPSADDRNHTLRVMVGGGAPKSIFAAFEKRFGVPLVEVYGMSEIGLPLNATIEDRVPGSCGRVHPDFEAKIVDDDGIEVGPHIAGELLIRPLIPYTVMLEYYKMPEKTAEAWRDLWLHTGDYLYYDEDGYFYFADRKKDALRRRGENVSSFEVESVINAHPAVLESAAIGVKADLGEDEVMACVTTRPGQHLEPLDLIKHCGERMAYFMVPRYVRLMAELPKTATQRVEKYRLREEGITADTWDREQAGYKLRR